MLATTFLISTTTLSVFATKKNIDIDANVKRQQGPGWCWAAAGQALCNFFCENEISQADFFKLTHNLDDTYQITDADKAQGGTQLQIVYGLLQAFKKQNIKGKVHLLVPSYNTEANELVHLNKCIIENGNQLFQDNELKLPEKLKKKECSNNMNEIIGAISQKSPVIVYFKVNPNFHALPLCFQDPNYHFENIGYFIKKRAEVGHYSLITGVHKDLVVFKDSNLPEMIKSFYMTQQDLDLICGLIWFEKDK